MFFFVQIIAFPIAEASNWEVNLSYRACFICLYIHPPTLLADLDLQDLL